MAKHVLERTQFLPITLEEAWTFFSTPRNLALITPPDMGFVIREPFDERPAFAGPYARRSLKADPTQTTDAPAASP